MANMWSQSSRKNRNTCHKDLQTIFDVVLQRHDCSWIFGRRGEELQNQLYADGRSKLKYPESMHNASPLSKAADIIPVVPGVGRIVGNKKSELKYFYTFAGIVKATMIELYEEGKIKWLLRWGGDWDSDQNFDDQNFNDLYHWEVISPQEYFAKSGLEPQMEATMPVEVEIGTIEGDELDGSEISNGRGSRRVDTNERMDW